MARGPLIVMSGPSGCGKSTLVRRLVGAGAWPLRLSVSVTTRKPRTGETDGVDYHYWKADRFRQGIDAGEFLEWADVFGNYYGTLQAEVKPYRDAGTGVLLEIDVNGWSQVRTACGDAVSIFIRTSSFEVLEERLRRRHSETEASLQRRLSGARTELARAHEYRHQVVNDDLNTALNELRTIIDPLFARVSDA